MTPTEAPAQAARRRNLLFFTTPRLWPHWPVLPVVRRRLNQLEPELGVLYDAAGCSGRPGYSATVFLSNWFCLPATEARLLALPREVHDTPEELADASWSVD